ncbi:hypothetical protein [Alkalicoccobacillus porphyridii]|uniref:Uncharacterized protein n=1 Tax=Alkalicoccobacillus porphyridii TaxID=2597270 RepID=A0A553ZU34_9BACI|nr:hypothetical protein [Alkalicoccobacillus porphyridii]TSB44974.1 hypothetical protein FN960_18540 [Alkalicoccobacillus porphyridii]
MKFFSYALLFWLLFGAGIPLLLRLMIIRPIAGYITLGVILVIWFSVHHYIKFKKRRPIEY